MVLWISPARRGLWLVNLGTSVRGRGGMAHRIASDDTRRRRSGVFTRRRLPSVDGRGIVTTLAAVVVEARIRDPGSLAIHRGEVEASPSETAYAEGNGGLWFRLSVHCSASCYGSAAVPDGATVSESLHVL